MLDFSHLEQYRENNRIEAKKALGGLPKSIWETYSAFANTLGGVILLGVIETVDKSFDSVNLPDPDSLIREFWRIINDPLKVSVNILAEKDVYVEEVNGDRIIVIKVPRADRADKPVYVDNDPRNTYRRSGESDYRCTYEEYQAMVRDAAIQLPDMRLVRGMGLEALNSESIRSFRQRIKLYRPGHMWERLDDEAFLQKIGAVGIDDGGSLRPTSAGLLMFGNREDILRAYPNFVLTYREQLDTEGHWTDTAWNGNVYEFYYWAYNKLQQDVKTPFKLENGRRVDDTPVRQVLREVLANCLVNADYHGCGGIVVSKGHQEITLSNPGSFRVPLDTAKKRRRVRPTERRDGADVSPRRCGRIHWRRHPQPVPRLESRGLAGAGLHGELLSSPRLTYTVYDEPLQRRKPNRRKASPAGRIVPATIADRISYRPPCKRSVCALQSAGRQPEPHRISLTAACR